MLCVSSWCYVSSYLLFFFFFNDTATTEIYTLSLHDALPISLSGRRKPSRGGPNVRLACNNRSEEHTSELQSLRHLVCRLLLEKKKTTNHRRSSHSKTIRSRSIRNPSEVN